jgi:hypothetical protein
MGAPIRRTVGGNVGAAFLAGLLVLAAQWSSALAADPQGVLADGGQRRRPYDRHLRQSTLWPDHLVGERYRSGWITSEGPTKSRSCPLWCAEGRVRVLRLAHHGHD